MTRLVLTLTVTQIFLGGINFQTYQPFENLLMSRAAPSSISCEEAEAAPHVDAVAHAPCNSDFCVMTFECPTKDQRSLASKSAPATLPTTGSFSYRVSFDAPVTKEHTASTYPDLLLSVVLRV